MPCARSAARRWSCIRITGRIKDMIIRGGENIYPREVEEHLLTHDRVADVQVFGIAHYKVPRKVRIVDAFPMTVTGKAQKFEMRKIMESRDDPAA